MPSQKRLPLALGLISFAVLLFEILLTRIFSVVLLYHFAYLAISLALLGLSLGALYVHYRPGLASPERVRSTVAVYSSLFGLATLGCALLLLHYRPLGVDLYGGLDLPTFWYLLMTYAAGTVPFLMAGVCVSCLLAAGREDIGRFYAYDLLGAAAGALAVIPVLDLLGAPLGLVVAAGVGVGSGLIQARGTTWRLRSLPVAVLGATLLLGLASLATPILTVRYSKGQLEEGILFEDWNSFSRVTAHTSPLGVKLRIDAGAATVINEAKFHPMLAKQISTPAMRLRPGGDMLVIGPGGGQDIAAAAQLGMQTIAGVELNPIVVELATETYRDLAGGLYDRDGVSVQVGEGRSFLARNDRRYDVVLMTNIDTWAATAAGSFTLAENHLYTVEAFKSYVEHLDQDGILSITRWFFAELPHETLRIMSLGLAALRAMGAENPAAHCVVIQNGAERPQATFLLKKTPFTEAELQQIQVVPRWEFVFRPNGVAHPVFRQLAEASDPADFLESYDYDVSAPTDDRPFFFYVVRAGDLFSSFKRDFYRVPNVTNIGVFLLVSSLFLNALFVALLIAVPVVVRRKSGGNDLRGVAPALLYFGCLGGGFMIVELTLMERFILFLGHPSLALTVVLFVILLSSGLGSQLSSRLSVEATRRWLPRWIGAAVILTVLATTLLPGVFDWAMGFPRPVRVGMSALCLAPIGFLLGTCFPSGVRLLGSRGEALLPWIWAINGGMSVLGSAAAMLLAMSRGFSTTLYVGLVLYVIAALCAPRLKDSGAGNSSA